MLDAVLHSLGCAAYALLQRLHDPKPVTMCQNECCVHVDRHCAVKARVQDAGK